MTRYAIISLSMRNRKIFGVLCENFILATSRLTFEWLEIEVDTVRTQQPWGSFLSQEKRIKKTMPMSIQVPESSQEPSSLKRSKPQKRKHREISSSTAPNVNPLQSPTKKAKKATLPPPGQKHSVAHTVLSGVLSESPFRLRTASLYLAVSPIALIKPLEGLCAEHLSPLLLTYYPPLGGVILAYSNPRLSESIDDPSSHASRRSLSLPCLWLSMA